MSCSNPNFIQVNQVQLIQLGCTSNVGSVLDSARFVITTAASAYLCTIYAVDFTAWELNQYVGTPVTIVNSVGTLEDFVIVARNDALDL